MLKRSQQLLIGAFFAFLCAFGLLWWKLAQPGPQAHTIEEKKSLPYLFSGKGSKFLGIGDEERRRTAYFDFSSSCIEAHKKGLASQRLQNIHGYIQTRTSASTGAQEIYYFSSPLGTYWPNVGELTMNQSHFTLAHLPAEISKEHLLKQAPVMEGAAKKTTISLEKGAQIGARRVRAIIYDTKGLKNSHE
jgi:hypothetical protein